MVPIIVETSTWQHLRSPCEIAWGAEVAVAELALEALLHLLLSELLLHLRHGGGCSKRRPGGEWGKTEEDPVEDVEKVGRSELGDK